MTLVRQFKKRMTAPEMVGLLPDADAGSAMQAEMVLVSSQLPENLFEKEIAAGNWTATVIQADGRPIYRIVWQMRGQTFSVVAAAAMAENADIHFLGAGIEKMARSLRAEKIYFTTKRKALVEQCRKWGAEVVTVCMEKKLAYD